MPREICIRCQRPLSVCYCEQIHHVANTWPIRILQDRRESAHALGTARIAALSLSNCRLSEFDPGHPQSAETRAVIEDAISAEPYAPILIYPGTDTTPLQCLVSQPIRPLIFLDASWRRSRLMLHTQSALAELPRYSLADVPISRYRIRSATQPEALSTLEAIVIALTVLEGRHDDYALVLQAMDWMIDQQIQKMGESVYQKNYRADNP